MNIDERKILIIQFNPATREWEDITKRVQWFEDRGNACRIKYFGNNNFYWKSWSELEIIDNPKNIDIAGKIVYCDKVPVYGLSEVIQFDSYVKIFSVSRYSKLVERNRIKIVRDISEIREIKTFINYLKAIALLMPTEDGQNFLLKQLDKLVVLENSVLGKFLQGKLGRQENKETVIFPFDTNSSQRIAVKRALNEDLSIVQGPPGTGKTETIRNIVANYVARGGCVAVVSGNNEATRNVKDKFESTGFGYLNAFLGNSDNVKKFFDAPYENIKQIEKSDNKNSERLLKETSDSAETYLKYSLDIARIVQSVSELETEKEISNAEYQIKKRVVPQELLKKRYTSTKLLELASILETLPENKITGFFNRARFLFRFGIIKAKEIVENREDSIEYLKNKYYEVKISELNSEKDKKQEFIDSNNLSQLLKEQKDLSMNIFLSCLQKRYESMSACAFSMSNYKSCFNDFAKRYPIVCVKKLYR